MGNILPLELDPRAELVQGTPKLPWSMMTGIEEGFTGCVFLGYHAGSGTADAILDHTYTGWFADIRVNGLSWNETHLNAALAGTFNVPLLFVSGDDECCNQATAALPWVQRVLDEDGVRLATSGRSKSPKTVQDATRRLVAESIKHADRAAGVEARRAVHPRSAAHLERARRHARDRAGHRAHERAVGAIRDRRHPDAVPDAADLDEPRPPRGARVAGRVAAAGATTVRRSPRPRNAGVTSLRSRAAAFTVMGIFASSIAINAAPTTGGEPSNRSSARGAVCRTPNSSSSSR